MMAAAKRPVPQPWPLSQYSQQVRSGELTWHVQSLGDGPLVCLLHGTGASTHSWRALATKLSKDFRVVMFDLPGHGQTTLPRSSGMSLTGMSHSIGALLKQLEVQPEFVVGHSAGAAIACQLTRDKHVSPAAIVSINGALQPFKGLAGQLFSPLAQLMANNEIVPSLVSWRVNQSDLVSRLLKDTGSVLDVQGQRYYEQLLKDKRHVRAALQMMARWDLNMLARHLPLLNVPLHLVVADNDKTVPPRQSIELVEKLKYGNLISLPALGHLAHEEAPVLFDSLLRDLFGSATQTQTQTRAAR